MDLRLPLVVPLSRCCIGSGPARFSLLFGLAVLGVPAEAASGRAALLQEDFPFQRAAIGAHFPANNVAYKGVAIRLEHDAAVCFDTDLLRMSAGWTGGFISTKGVTFDGAHGAHPEIVGMQRFGTRQAPGWANADGEFTDPRPEPFGPLPDGWGRWRGLYVQGDRVVLAYTVLGTDIFEQPAAVSVAGETLILRTLRIENPGTLGLFGKKTQQPLTLRVCSVEGAEAKREDGVVHLTSATTLVTSAGLINAPAGVELEAANGDVLLRIPKGTANATFSVVVWNGPRELQPRFPELLAQAALEKDKLTLPDFKAGGPAHWPETVITQGELAYSSTPDGAYVTDRLTPPERNPWNRRVRFGGMDFFPDGKRAALSTWDGDVWIVSGIDESLEKLTWRRFASGGFENLGLKIVDGVIHTSGRDEITRYHDLNGDGEADFYECFNNDITSSQGFHEFVFDLQTDRAGNFYLAKAGPVRSGGRGFGGGGGNGVITRDAGTVMRVSRDGSKLETYATGFRAPNGIGVHPVSGQVTTGDNEGSWMPTCPINWVREGGFYGVETLAHRESIPAFDKPLCWLAKSWDNSGGGQVWVTSDKWGPYQGELLHTSYGQSALYLVTRQAVGDEMQGGVVQIPVKFTSSAMRPRFNPRDGQLYIAGLRGWQSNAARETGFDRVRYTGKPVYSLRGFQADSQGIHLTFTQPLDFKNAIDSENYHAQQWNYRRSQDYGSPEFSVINPDKRGRDTLRIGKARLSADGRTVTLEVPNLQPVHQLLIKFNVQAHDGTRIRQESLQTLHTVPPRAETIAATGSQR